MTFPTLIKRVEAWLPIAVALVALAMVVSRLVIVGTAPEADEGTLAHLYQLLMLVQFGAVVVFLVQWLPREPRTALWVLAAQLVATAAAIWPVWHYRL